MFLKIHLATFQHLGQQRLFANCRTRMASCYTERVGSDTFVFEVECQLAGTETVQFKDKLIWMA